MPAVHCAMRRPRCIKRSKGSIVRWRLVAVDRRFPFGAEVGAAKARGDRPWRFTEAVSAALRLPCDARSRGPSQNSLRSLRSLRSDSCDESVDEARCARSHSPALLGASQARHGLSPRAFAPRRRIFAIEQNEPPQRGRRHPLGAIFGATERRPGVGARSALRCLTRRSCLSGVSVANAASSATRPQVEHHSAVGAKRRPPQHEPPADAACRAARTPRGGGPLQTTATGRQRSRDGSERGGIQGASS